MRKKGAKKNDVRENIRILLEKYDRQHLLNQVKRKKNIDMIYDELCKEAARLGKQTNFNDPDAPFYFSDYPETQKKIDQLIAKHASKMQTLIEQGDEDEWMLSVRKNNAMIGMLTAGTKIPESTLKAWTQPHLDALAAFQQRKQNGMGLSERVWNLSQQTKQELELALDIGLGEGKSAAELSRDVRKFLNEPHKLFRRVRDKHGVLRLSKAARAYHPGQGVYRSSYKNAIRMTGTENNMAYRTADHEKWGKLDFVIGIEIRLSNNHTLNGKPFHDICDEMVGKYPKDFKFTGWHPQCRCFAIPILADWEEQLKVMDMQDAGEDLSNYHYAGEVTEMPEGYGKWMEDNAERIANAKSLPYFIKDNPEYTSGRLNKIQDNGSVLLGYEPLVEQERKFVESCVHNLGKKMELFNNDVNIVFTNTLEKGVMMEWGKDRTLYISTARYEAEGVEGGFTVGRSLMNAFKKLSTGQSSKLLFNEEYALECLFHEHVHSIYSPEKFVFHPKSANGIIAETCTQIYARRHYNEMIKAFDKNALFPNYGKIQTEGLGYKRYCGYARSLTKGNLTDELLLSVIKEEVAGADVLVGQLMKKELSKDVSESLIYSLFRSR